MRGLTWCGVLAVTFALSAVACGGDDESSGGTGNKGGTGGSGTGGASGSGTGGQSGSGTGGQSGSGTGGGVGYDIYAEQRKACTFASGTKTTDTVGPNVPHGDSLPFEHIVVLMMENRSFDHYFSKLPEYGVTDVAVAGDNYTNLDPDANPPAPVARFHETRYCTVDVNHEWDGSHLQYNNGAMDGFVATNNPGGARAMGYFDETDLGYYYWMAKSFAISDRHFCSLLGPTWPNRFYFYSGSSWGNIKTGDFGFLTNAAFQASTNILEQMEQAGRTWQIYRDGITSFAVLLDISYVGTGIDTFEADVDADNLPDLAVIDPNFTGSGQNDEHPPSNQQLGQQFTARILNKLMSNPTVWQKTVFILFYDEHGGYADHVPPPEACIPDGVAPATFAFDRLGIRTPLVIASPWIKPGYVSHTDTDLTSVTRFIQNRFDLPAMTARDANAWPMLDMFDFGTPALATPPSGAPDATANPAGIDYCANNPPGTGLP
jgi:phospholipase C